MGEGFFVRLHHGTTRGWAEAILANGPDPYFRPPGVEGEPEGFFTARAEGPFPFGSPELAARGKAWEYSETGLAVILEIDIPEALWADLVGKRGEEESGKGVGRGGEVWFGIDFWDTKIDFGATKLREVWPQLHKAILPLEKK